MKARWRVGLLAHCWRWDPLVFDRARRVLGSEDDMFVQKLSPAQTLIIVSIEVTSFFFIESVPFFGVARGRSSDNGIAGRSLNDDIAYSVYACSSLRSHSPRSSWRLEEAVGELP